MATILAVGIATLDIINTVERYPSEDSETRASHHHKTRGGNATNTLTVLSQLGHQCHWAGILIDEPDSRIISQNLAQHNINTAACKQLAEGKMPTSYITHNKKTGSRTIVHYRDCPEYDFASFKKIDLGSFDWIHFEGRNVSETEQMLTYLKQTYPDLPCSLEVEKTRPNIETLFSLPDWLFFSKDYAASQEYTDAASFLNEINSDKNSQATCTWGGKGAWLSHKGQDLSHQKVITKAPIIDTLAAGDTFNAGFIHSQTQGMTAHDSLNYATQLASHKCTRFGLESITTDFALQS
jgi:ketohexokinase